MEIQNAMFETFFAVYTELVRVCYSDFGSGDHSFNFDVATIGSFVTLAFGFQVDKANGVFDEGQVV